MQAAQAVLDQLNALCADASWFLLRLDEATGHGLVISRDCVAQRAYNAPETVTWETSDLRAWLNDEHYKSLPAAFQERIIKTHVTTPPNCSIPGGNDTDDYLFLLSIEEYTDLLPEELKVARFHGEPCWWWLRSPGYSTGDVADVYPDGNLDGGIAAHGFYAFADCGGVRPAMILDLTQ